MDAVPDQALAESHSGCAAFLPTAPLANIKGFSKVSVY